jgi:hypothetical protein
MKNKYEKPVEKFCGLFNIQTTFDNYLVNLLFVYYNFVYEKTFTFDIYDYTLFNVNAHAAG